jgi:hypothetical protein
MARFHEWTGVSGGVGLGPVSAVVTPELVGGALAECGLPVGAQAPLPMEFMVDFVLAMALFADCSYQNVIEHMIGAFPELACSVPNKSNLTRARRRLGAGVMRLIYQKLAAAQAGEDQPGAFYQGMRLAAVDGILLDLPESAGNRARFGGQEQSPGHPRGLPVARVVALTETGTRAQVAARLGGWHDAELTLAKDLAAHAPGMLVIIDRLYPDVRLWQGFEGAGADLVIRAREQVAATPEQVLPDGTYLARMRESGYKGNTKRSVLVRVIEYQVADGDKIRLLTSLRDPETYPAEQVAALYPERWEAEGANRQIKSFQRGDGVTLRSKDPELIEQEIWAHLIVHTVVTRFITTLARAEGIDPDRISYTNTLEQLRLAVTRHTRAPEDTPPAPAQPTREHQAPDPLTHHPFIRMLTTRAKRLLDNGAKRLRASDRQVSKPPSKYPKRPIAQKTSPRTRKTTPKAITLLPRPILS